MPKTFKYAPTVEWTGNRGDGTTTYTAYGRDHVITAENRPPLLGSADPAFRGDPTKYTPEDLLVAALSACHMLWYLHLCADAGIVVTKYVDHPEGVLTVQGGGAGRFTSAVLRPEVTLSSGDPAKAKALHERAHELCFIANSVNFALSVEPVLR